MDQYKQMYAILCGAMSDALDELPELPENVFVRKILKNALLEAEEIYINTGQE